MTARGDHPPGEGRTVIVLHEVAVEPPLIDGARARITASCDFSTPCEAAESTRSAPTRSRDRALLAIGAPPESGVAEQTARASADGRDQMHERLPTPRDAVPVSKGGEHAREVERGHEPGE